RGALLTEHIRELGYELHDYGDVEIVRPDYLALKQENPKYLNEILRASASVSETLKRILSDGALPVILGGDHSIAIGTFSGISSFFRERNEEIGLIWFDAHADINTPESSPSGNIHGMPLAVILGHGEE